MIEKKYRCNLCGNAQEPRPLIGPSRLIGIRWGIDNVIEEADPAISESHLCVKCLSGLQAFEPRCGDGFKCSGGPKCLSDHK